MSCSDSTVEASATGSASSRSMSTSEELERRSGREALVVMSKFLVRSSRDLGAWRPGDLLLGLYYLKGYHMANAPVWSRIDPDEDMLELLEEAEHYAWLAEFAYSKDKGVLQLRTGFSKRSIARHVTKSTITAPGHFIAVDKDREEVILSVRGTKKMSDCLTDCASAAVDFMGGKGHEGFKESAMWLQKNAYPKIKKLLAKFDGYSLVVTGHSLGAATAAMFTMLIREEEPNVRAVVFAVPPCLSLELSGETMPYITSFVFDFDVIPRFTMAAVEDLREDLYSYPWWTMAKRDFGVAFDKGKEMTIDAIDAVGRTRLGAAPVALGKMGVKGVKTGVYVAMGLYSALNADANKGKGKGKGKSKSKSESKSKSKSKGKSKSKSKKKCKKSKSKHEADPDNPIPKPFKRKKNISRLYCPGNIYHLYRVRGDDNDVKAICCAPAAPDVFDRIVLHDTMLADHKQTSATGTGYIQAIRIAAGKDPVSSSMTSSRDLMSSEEEDGPSTTT